MQRVSCGNAGEQRHGKRCERNQERQRNRVGIEIPDLGYPLQRDAGLDAAKIVHGDARRDRQARRHDEERRDKERKQKLAGEDQAVAHARHPAAATAPPVNERASASMNQVMTPSPTESAADVAKFAASVNSV